MVRLSVMLVIGVCVLAVASVAQADLTFTTLAGGTGGTLFTQTCPNGFYLNGIRGRAGSFIDSVAGVCNRKNTIGEVTNTTILSSTGGSGGTAFDLRCPLGWAVNGLRGRAGSLVDRIQLLCAPVQTSGGTVVLAAESVDPFRAGGTGGTSFERHCASNLPARAIRGRAGSLIDAIGLGCELTGIRPVIPTSSTLPDLRVVVHDLPFRARRNNIVSYETSLWNIGGVDAPAGAEMDLLSNFPFSFPTIDAGFVGGTSCDVNNPPPIRGHFVRCETRTPTPRLTRGMRITVTFTADATPGDYLFGGQADPAFLLPEANETSNNVTLKELLVVDAGFSGAWEDVAKHCHHSGQGSTCKVEGTIDVENPGTGSTAVHSAVAFFLSSDELLDEHDTFLATANVGVLQAGASKRVRFNANLEEGLDPSGWFVIAVLDASHAVDERNEDNNVVVSPPIP